MTTERSKNGAMTLFRMNFSGYVGQVTAAQKSKPLPNCQKIVIKSY